MKKLYIILFIGVVIVGLFFRYHNLYTWPRLGATFDEYAWTWQGINLLQKGVPISWSPHPQYENATPITYQKTHFRIVEPFLEHPPLFGLLAGGYALANGVDGPYKVHINNIRGLSLILGSLSIVMVMLLALDMYGRKVSLVAGILYATIPSIVVGSRIVQNENFFIPFFLLSVYFAHKYIRSKKKKYRNLAILISSLLVLAKIPWIAAPFSVFIIFLYFKKYKDAAFTFVLALISLLLFISYGAYYNLNLFINLSKLQTARYDLGFESIYALFQKPYLVDRYYTDGWILIGFITIIALFSNVKKHVFLLFPFLAYFLVFLAGVPDEAGHGWYRYPFYPFIVISLAIFIKEYFAKNFFLTFLFLVGIGFNLFHQTWTYTFGFSFFLFRFIIFAWGFILIPPFFPPFKKPATIIAYFSLGLLILLNMWSILSYNEQ